MADRQNLRERRAQLTRDEILVAARRLFAERGYARTSVRDVAREAGVSAQTVYDSVGSKQTLVARLNDLIDSEADIASLAAQASASRDPATVAATSARVTRSIVEHCGDIVRALVTGAAAEPELQRVLDEGHRRHLAGARFTVSALEELGALAEGLPVDEAVENLAALTDIQHALLLQTGYGWSADRVEEWMATTSRLMLLRRRDD